jgi:hypothetical protein
VVRIAGGEPMTHELERPSVDAFWSEHRYRRELTIIRWLITIALVISLIMPGAAGAAIAAVMTAYAFFYRNHIGLRWVLLPAFFTIFLIAGLVIAAVANRPEVETLVGP